MMKIKRCQKCKKNTLTEISGEPQKINPFTIRSYVGIQCSSCNWNEKIYTFTSVEEEGKGHLPPRFLHGFG